MAKNIFDKVLARSQKKDTYFIRNAIGRTVANNLTWRDAQDQAWEMGTDIAGSKGAIYRHSDGALMDRITGKVQR